MRTLKVKIAHIIVLFDWHAFIEKKYDNALITGYFICDLRIRQNDDYFYLYICQALFRYLDQKTGMKEGTTNFTIATFIYDTLIMEVQYFIYV